MEQPRDSAGLFHFYSIQRIRRYQIGVQRLSDQDTKLVAWLDPGDDESATSLDAEKG
jgi:hypothetical protein